MYEPVSMYEILKKWMTTRCRCPNPMDKPFFKEWMAASYSLNELTEMSRGSVSKGFRGLTFCYETTRLYQRYSGEIWAIARDDVNGNNKAVFMMLIDFFNVKFVYSARQIHRLLVWYAAQQVAFELSEEEFNSHEMEINDYFDD